MTVASRSESPVAVERRGRGTSALAQFARRVLSNRPVWPALAVLAAFVLAGAFAPVLAPYDPLDQDLRNTFSGPSADHWLGTDNLGRDVLSRLMFGARIGLIAIGQGVAVAVVIGVPIGLLIGYRGGWLDRIVMRGVEAIVAIPGIMLAIVMVTILGIGLTNAMLAVGIGFSTVFIRLCRGLVVAEREEDYIRATRVLGASERRTIWRHLLPNVAGPLIVQVTVTCGAVLLAEAGLSFLGLAVQPPDASWGTMLSTASQFTALHPMQAVPPGFAIFLVVLSVNLVGDAMRDSLRRGDVLPKRRRRIIRRSTTSVPATVRTHPGEAPDTDISDAGGGDDLALRMVGVDVRFPSDDGSDWNRVISDVSLSVRRGESMGLVGESGSGKSITAAAALGMIPRPGVITAGQVVVDGVDVVHSSPRQLAKMRGSRVAAVFQDPMASLNPAMKVGPQIAEVLRVRGGLSRRAAASRSIELLTMVGIPDAARRSRDYPHQFSGGMIQRAAIARALSCEPALLIADEPTTALDVTVQDEILQLLRDLQRELGMAILFISHDLAVVSEICDRTAVMYAGEVVEVTEIDELLSRPRHPYTEALLESVPSASSRLERLPTIPGTVPKPGDWNLGCRFAPRCRHARPECEAAVEMESVHGLAPRAGQHLVRCRRWHELELSGVTRKDVSDAVGG